MMFQLSAFFQYHHWSHFLLTQLFWYGSKRMQTILCVYVFVFISISDLRWKKRPVSWKCFEPKTFLLVWKLLIFQQKKASPFSIFQSLTFIRSHSHHVFFEGLLSFNESNQKRMQTILCVYVFVFISISDLRWKKRLVHWELRIPKKIAHN